ncbi:hypothetical protein ACSBR1_013664 [Camellia fascicularis]
MGLVTEILRKRCSEKAVVIVTIVSCLAGGYVGSRLGTAHFWPGRNTSFIPCASWKRVVAVEQNFNGKN